MTDRIQQLMYQAYDRWQANVGWSQQEFWDQLSADERFAVFIGNMNYQVENGGFLQWWDNRYATEETASYIQWACSQIDTPAARRVAEIVAEFWSMVHNVDPDYPGGSYEDGDWEHEVAIAEALDRDYDAVNQQFLADAEAYLAQA